MFRVPESCPRIALQAETRMIGMKHRIWQQKLCLMLKLNRQSPTTLSRMILEEQRSNNWPGLSKEVTQICESLEIPNLNENDFDISVASIKEAVMDHHDSELKEKILKSTKMEKVKTDDFSKVITRVLEREVY